LDTRRYMPGMSIASPISAVQAEIVDEFSLMTDWQDRYAHLVEIGRESPRMDPALKTEDRKVRGCQAQVWLAAELVDGRLRLHAESDALIVQGLVALLLRVYSEQTPADILHSSTEFLRQIGLDRHLTQNRANGLASMIAEIRRLATEAAGAGAPAT
jgi:cysteine desulfuration protein SufE